MSRSQSIHHEVQSNFHKHENQVHDRERGKNMAGRAKHEILAPKVEFCTLMCDQGLSYFTKNFARHAADLPATILFPVSRVVHNMKNSLRDGGHPKRERIALGTNVRLDKQKI